MLVMALLDPVTTNVALVTVFQPCPPSGRGFALSKGQELPLRSRVRREGRLP